MAWRSEDDLRGSLLSVGRDVRVDDSVRLLNPSGISLGSHVRIDAGCTISATHRVVIGDHVHIAFDCRVLAWDADVTFEDFSGLAPAVTIMTGSDDYRGGFLSGPTVPAEFRNVRAAPVTLERHAIIGTGAVLLPGVTVGWGATVGALTVVSRDVEPGTVVAGSPARVVAKRDVEALSEMERRFRAQRSDE